MKSLIMPAVLIFLMGSIADASRIVRMPKDLQSQASLIEQVMQDSVSHEKIIFFGETHKSRAEFARVGNPFLAFLAKRGFDCLLLEWDESFNSALRKFSSGVSYGDSVYLQKIRTYGEWVALATEDGFDRQILEFARDLGYRVVAIDLNSSNYDHSFVFKVKSSHAAKEYLEMQMNRNVTMAHRIAQVVNSRLCSKAVVVNGSTHLDPTPLATYSNRSLLSIPKILEKARWSTKSYRLTNEVSATEADSIYQAIFAYGTNANFDTDKNKK